LGRWRTPPADRHDRKRTMIVCDVLSGAISLLLAALMAAGMLQLRDADRRRRGGLEDLRISRIGV